MKFVAFHFAAELPFVSVSMATREAFRGDRCLDGSLRVAGGTFAPLSPSILATLWERCSIFPGQVVKEIHCLSDLHQVISFEWPQEA